MNVVRIWITGDRNTRRAKEIYTKVNNTTVATNSYTDNSLTASTAYFYKIAAENAVGESNQSVSATTTTS